MDLYGNSAVLVLEADADFIQAMDDFYQALYVGIVISVVMLVLLTFFLITATSLFMRTESRLYQAQRLASLGQMAATVAHEIRNPLAIIKSTADVLREKDVHNQELFGYINDEVSRLNRLVTDFLSFAREPVLNQSPCDLVSLIGQTVAKHALEVPIHWEAPDLPIVLSCDSDRIRQVLDNLLLNARQAISGPQGRIKVVLHQERIRGNLYVQVSVIDNGPGLQGHGVDLFEPFFTTKTSGTGLGLAVCKSIIERHGGRIEALEQPDGGSEFRFFLPLKNTLI
jgi:two-component system, NtrC family, sensor histidine kinase HydH